MKSEEIAAVPLFAGLSREQLERVASVSRAVQFPAGHVVVNQGEFAFDFYALRRGSAEVLRSGERIGTLGAGDVFGEMGVVAGASGRLRRRRGATVRITDPAEAIAIDGADFRRLSEEIPALRAAIEATAAEREPAAP